MADTTTTTTQPPIRIAIIGGGIAGATLANALYQIPHLEVSVFEAAPTFSERGAAVGLAGDAQAALSHVIPSSKQLLSQAGAVPMNSTRLVIGSGPQAGTIIADMAEDPENPGMVLHRASLLRELLAPLPAALLHANKKLSAIRETEEDGTLSVTFEDGVTRQFDAVIGADGIFSSVRAHVLGDSAAKEHAASPAGFWDCRVMVPYEKAKAALGEEYFDQDRQYGWIGDQAFVMHDIAEARTQVQVVISAVEKESPREGRKQKLTREGLKETLKDWLGGPIGDGAIELLLDQEDPHSYSQYEHKSTPTYSRGRVCIVGDAAHATTPWQGAGAGQAFEDAVILEALFRRVTSAREIEAAFKAYDALRRPRGQQVIDSSRGTGKILTGSDEGVGLDPEKMGPALGPRWAFLYSLDLNAYKKEAVEKFREFQGHQL
ncbi:salicylate hydroxylase [Cladorrhinum sp. PSN259]|nr:salicylate hydroxylase [Cladorrhinum sp. PSN259]